MAAERLQLLLRLFPTAEFSPNIPVIDNSGEISLDTDQALVELIRSRLEGLGPVSAKHLAAPLGMQEEQINISLLALEQEGYAIQGRFTTTVGDIEWCERGLLARIHRYTLKTLRREIQTVSPADYMRFLFAWHRIEDKRDGKEALASVLDQLEGCALPAYSWERDILPARIEFYVSDWLDNLCNSGRFTWLRLSPGKESSKEASNSKRKSGPVKNTPISMLARQNTGYWCEQEKLTTGAKNLSSIAQKVYTMLKNQGASFFFDIVTGTQLLRTQTEDALAELVSLGLVSSDSYSGLRALITPASKKPSFKSRRRNYRRSNANIDDAGRWTLVQKSIPPQNHDTVLAPFDVEKTEHIAKVLLNRYGIVFRKVIEKESSLPPWRDLLYIFRRMEARGEIRGGRFVSGFAGEQFALPQAATELRSIRNKNKNGDLLAISAVDPLNLTGIITPGQRVPSQINNRILYQDGKPIAVNIAGAIKIFEKLDNQTEWEIKNRLIRQQNPTGYIPNQSQQM